MVQSVDVTLLVQLKEILFLPAAVLHLWQSSQAKYTYGCFLTQFCQVMLVSQTQICKQSSWQQLWTASPTRS